MKLTVATINILSDLSFWEARRGLLAEGLSVVAPDLLAVQEARMDLNNAGWLADQVGLPFIYQVPKAGESGEKEGIAILSRFPFERRESLDLGSQDRVAQYVHIRVGGNLLLFANSHLYWQPGESQARLDQVERLSAWVGQAGDMAKIVCGDFNGTPETRAIQRMKLGFRSAYETVNGREPIYTAPTPLPRSMSSIFRTLMKYFRQVKLKELTTVWRGTLDYIFMDEILDVEECRIILNQPAKNDRKLYPSDHFGLMAKLVMTAS